MMIKHRGKLLPCSDCGHIRLVRIERGTPKSLLCRKCSNKTNARKGSLHPQWKGGRIVTGQGYIRVWVFENDIMAAMRNSSGYVLEHRLLMARHLGRPLLPNEFVHHKNGIKDDNHIENLELISRNNHSILDRLCAHCELRKEIRLLKWQVKELQRQMARRGVFND